MTFKNLILILSACVSGFLGGTLASQKHAQAAGPDVVRASRFELINAAGIAVASWEIDSKGEARLHFLYNHDAVGMDIGVLADGRPFLRMGGRDGKKRLVMELDQFDKPMLGMGDERWEGRVHLGFIEPDAIPYGDWDNWGLSFRAYGSERPIAGIGMAKIISSRYRGFLTISGKSIP